MNRGVRILPALFAFATLALGQADVVVRKGGETKSGLDLSALKAEGQQAGVFLKTVENDLRLSGWFTILPGTGALVVQGTYTESGNRGSAAFQVGNRVTGQRWISQTIEKEQPAVRKLAHAVADAIVRGVKGVPGIASTRIVMVGSRGGSKNLYLCDADGGDMLQVTRDDGICISPCWTPDAQAIAYTSYARGSPNVFLIDLVTLQRRILAAFPGLNIAGDVSPNGRNIVLALSKDGNPDLYVMDMGGRSLERVTRTSQAAEASGSWSPDGKSIVYVSDKAGHPQLFVSDAAGRSEKRITFRGSENVAPDWGANGWIAYCSRRGGAYVICVLDPESDMEQQVTGEDADYEDPSWAPDGRHIVCSRKSGRTSDIYVLDTKGDNPLRLTRLQGNWSSPAWSPK